MGRRKERRAAATLTPAQGHSFWACNLRGRDRTHVLFKPPGLRGSVTAATGNCYRTDGNQVDGEGSGKGADAGEDPGPAGVAVTLPVCLLPESGWSSSRAPSPPGSSPGASWLARASWASSWVW